MKNTKKILSLLLTVIMLICAVPVCASAENTFTEGYYTYTVTDGYATITDVDDTISGDVVVPDTLGGYSVKKIDGAFYSCYYITSVTIPGTVETIDSSFSYCIQLEKVIFYENLKEITGESFSYCFYIKEITFPRSLKVVDGFNVCISLESVKFPEGLESITGFSACHKLCKVELPLTLKTLGGYTFGCTPLRSIVIPESVTNIGIDTDAHTFVDCLLLKDVYIKSDNAQIVPATLGFSRFEWQLEPADYYNMQYDYWMKGAEYLLTQDEKYMDEVNKIIAEVEANGKGYETNQPVAGVTVYGKPGSTAETYAETMGLKFEEITDKTTIKDTATNVEAEFESGTFSENVEMVITKNGENANIAFADDYSKYASFDISFVAGTEKVQPDGEVTVKLPIPSDFNADTTEVYLVDDNGNAEKLESTTENGFVVFVTDHFSEYVLVDESSKIEEPTEPDEPEVPEEPSDRCDHLCHKSGFMGFLWKIVQFFWKLFKMNPVCECGAAHY